jgi:hypothetical protein
MRRIVTAFFLMLIALTARAEMTVAQYESGLQTKRTAKIVRLYVHGLGDGMAWANEIPGQAPFYCTPANKPVGDEEYFDLINLQIEASNSQMSAGEVANLSVGLLLLKGLQEVFPCKGN